MSHFLCIFAANYRNIMQIRILSSIRARLGLILLALVSIAGSLPCHAQTCSPTATFSYTDSEGNPVEEDADSYTGSAPLKAVFHANPQDADDFEARYEWFIYEQSDESKPIVHRFEEDLEYTFSQSGTYFIELKATFTQGSDTVVYPEEGEEGTRFSVSIAESHLEMPNAFSPGDDDDFNKIYKAKDNHQSIVEFKATIFNRWGQKLYSWNDINGGWDGKVNGRVVKNGVYFVNVVAKGADGRVYHIRKDVNVLTRYNNETGTSGGTEQ